MYKLAAIIVLFALVVACGGGDDLDFPDRQIKLPDLTQAGGVAGRILFHGNPPPQKTLRAPDAHCAQTGHVIPDETIVVTKGKLANVLVYVKTGLEGYTFPYEKSEFVIDQVGCVFRPHVAAVRSYQPLRFKNGDPIIHNVNLGSKKKNQGLVATITPGQGSILRQLRKPEIGINVTCDLHANMLMTIHVLDHPYFAVTGTDGSFIIKDLPPGQYQIAARHRTLGNQDRLIEVHAQEVIKDIDFTFTADN